MQTVLKSWQSEALDAWVRAGMRGLAIAPTGAGKTLLGIAAAQIIRTSSNCLIVVHTENLLDQWYKMLEFELDETVGRIGAGYNDIRPITVGIINSLRDKVLSYFGGVIIDEVHHLPSEKNISLLTNNSFSAVLGLTSTLEREDSRHEQFKAYGLHVIHVLDYQKAISEKLLSGFEIVNVAVGLNAVEQQKNIKYSDFIDTHLPSYNYDLKTIIRFIAIDERARILMRCIQKRKQLLGLAESKVAAVARIVLMEAQSPDFKAIIFSEFIENAEHVRLQLEIVGFNAGIYHSGITRQQRVEVIDAFRTDKINVLISCKALEEGLNVPNANLGIIVGGSGVKRQIIQRLGRILRHLPGKTARLYQVYVAGTQDEKWMVRRTAVVAREATSVKNLEWRDRDGIGTAR